MPLNVPLLRELQWSIANPERPFVMNNWCDCISGHMKYFGDWVDVAHVRDVLGLTVQQAIRLFHQENWPLSAWRFDTYPYRIAAVKNIDFLIDDPEGFAAGRTTPCLGIAAALCRPWEVPTQVEEPVLTAA